MKKHKVNLEIMDDYICVTIPIEAVQQHKKEREVFKHLGAAVFEMVFDEINPEGEA